MIDILDINTVDKTPIEIALGIDKDGMTTAKKLYEFLELHPAHYAKWCKVNILGNKFAERDKDYFVFNNDVENPRNQVFTLEGENLSKGGRPTKDYKLTATFAKKLAMSANNEQGEQAKAYFIKIEDAMKQVAAVVKSDKLSNLNNITFMKAMLAEMEEQRNNIADLDERVTKIENTKQINVIDITPSNKVSAYVRNNVYSPTSIAKAFGMGAVTLNNILATEGIIKRVYVYSAQSCREEQCWTVTDKYRNMKYSAQRFAGVKGLNGAKPVEVTYAWTPKGVAFIVNLLRMKGYTQHSEINNRTKMRTKRKASV